MEIVERKERVVAEPLSLVHPIVIAAERGATLTDVDGNTFIDFTGGVGCLNVGHSPSAGRRGGAGAARALRAHRLHDRPVRGLRRARRAADRARADLGAKAAFFNAGTEAIENAIKFARSYTKRPAVIAFEGAFHGRTLLSMTMTSKTHPYKAGLGPFAPEVYRVPSARVPRPRRRGSARGTLGACFVTQVAAESVAAIVIEPIQGEGGFVVAPTEFVQGVRAICDEHGIVFVVDEVQTGFGRTGKLFAIEHYGVEPDLITVAKSIAAGLPLSGVIGKAEIMDAPPDSAIGGTYVGNPVAQAAALAVLDVIEEEDLVDRASVVGDTDARADARLAGALRRRSATFAAWARCSRSSSSRTRDEGARPRARLGGDRGGGQAGCS